MPTINHKSKSMRRGDNNEQPAFAFVGPMQHGQKEYVREVFKHFGCTFAGMTATAATGCCNCCTMGEEGGNKQQQATCICVCGANTMPLLTLPTHQWCGESII